MAQWIKKQDGVYENQAGTIQLRRENKTYRGDRIPAVWFIYDAVTGKRITGTGESGTLSQVKQVGLIHAAFKVPVPAHDTARAEKS